MTESGRQGTCLPKDKEIQEKIWQYQKISENVTWYSEFQIPNIMQCYAVWQVEKLYKTHKYSFQIFNKGYLFYKTMIEEIF